MVRVDKITELVVLSYKMNEELEYLKDLLVDYNEDNQVIGCFYMIKALNEYMESGLIELSTEKINSEEKKKEVTV